MMFEFVGMLMAIQLVDSDLASTRRHWRQKLGFPQFSDDPRPFGECLDELMIIRRGDMSEARP